MKVLDDRNFEARELHGHINGIKLAQHRAAVLMRLRRLKKLKTGQNLS